MESLAVKYRPTKFEDVCSQDSIITILKRQLELKQLQHAYLFCGASGCGKTTVARIFANEINNYQGVPIEIDAASHNSVDDVKTIVDDAFKRSLSSIYKIYIIDECQAFGNGSANGATNKAWQAMLKLIEEPPEYTIFIFCTTDPQKVPATILNRVMRFNFTRMTPNIIQNRLNYICVTDGYTNYNETCDYISRICNGGMRDAIALLEKVANYSTDLSITNALTVLGNFTYDIMFDLVNALIDGNEATVIEILTNLYNAGNDLRLFIDQFFTFCLDLKKYLLFNQITMTSLPQNYEPAIKNAVGISEALSYYTYLINKVLECRNMIKYDQAIKTTIEVCLLNICRCL